MKYLLLYSTLLFISFALPAQNIPVNFEEAGNGADWNWTVFENDTNPALEIIPNPDPSGLNTSATVAKFTALESGMPFAGCETLHGAGIGSFTIDADNAVIRILVWKSVISDVGIKLVRADNWSLGEIKVSNTVVNQWEQLEFDFSAHIGNTYDQLVIFPDFDDRATDNIIYFDEVYGAEALASSIFDPNPPRLTLAPNPVSDRLQLRTALPIGEYQIFSITGERVSASAATGRTDVDVQQLPTGTYLLKVRIGGEWIAQKFIKE